MSVYDIPKSIFNSVEKVLRYLVPGLLFVFFVKASFLPSTLNRFSLNITQAEFYLLSPVFGFAIYVVHRIVFWFMDWGCRSFCKITLAESLHGQATRKKNFVELAEVLYYRWAVVHFGLILSELTILFLSLAENDPIISFYSRELWIFAIVLLIICVVFYNQLNIADLKLIKKPNGTCC